MYIEFNVTIKKNMRDYGNYDKQITKEFAIDLPDDMQTTLDIGGMANAVVAAAVEAYQKAQAEQPEQLPED